jgi:putative endopeptidase
MQGKMLLLVLSTIIPTLTVRSQDVSGAPMGVGKAGAATIGSWGFQTEGVNRAVRPGDDFFSYAVGAYVKSLVIPPDRQSAGLAQKMNERNQLEIESLIRGEVSTPGPSVTERKVARLYEAYMNEELIETRGTHPLDIDLNRIRQVRTKSGMSLVMGESLGRFGSGLYSVHISPDDKDATKYAINLHQSGLGLPSRDYYIKPEFAEALKKYQSYVEQLLILISWPEPQQNAARVVAFETRIAQNSWTNNEQRDPLKTYNILNRKELAHLTAGFDMAQFLNGADIGTENRFIVNELTAFPKLSGVFAQTPLGTLKAWEAFRVVDQAGPLLPKRFVEANFQFRRRVLRGQLEIAPRSKRVMSIEDGTLGEAVGHIYVNRYFKESARVQMGDLVARLKQAMRRRIEDAPWLSDSARHEALRKLEIMSVGIGAPDHWKTFAFPVSLRDLYGDVERGRTWQYREDIRSLHHPVDRHAWGLLPQSTESEYNALLNRITFPAADLQPPFFDPNADPAVNYGAIGVVIGHELTHGFDDEGRKIDSSGNLRNWWTPEDAKRFDSQAQQVAKQYSEFEPLPGMHVNGEATLGEDLADTGGLALALDAYHSFLGGKEAPILDGLTGDQRLFLSCAQVWAGKTRPDALREELVSDPHPPGESRVNGEVRNSDTWYTAFHIVPGDKLYIDPRDRVHLW